MAREPVTAAAERCKHGLRVGTCAMCLPATRPARVPAAREERAPSAASLYEKPVDGLSVVRTAKGRARCGVESIDKSTTFVHIDGHPFLWAIEGILSRGPNVKTIQVIPSQYSKVRGAMELCKARGVEVVKGHYRPELAWDEHRIVSPVYEAQRSFMLNLSGEQRGLFDELLALGFENAQIAARYYCVSGEEFIPQRLVASEHGFQESANAVVSSKVLAVLYYLDSRTAVGEASQRRAAAMRQQVERLRPYLASAAHRQRLCADLGIDRLAENFPLARADVLRELLVAKRNGRLDAMGIDHPRQRQALALRFGLDEGAAVYRKLEDVGQIMDGVTRERARQLEERGLELLGIEDT